MTIVTTLSYGNGITCELDSDRITRLHARCSSALSESEIVAGIRASLAEPLDYPALADATVPGDQAVIALAEGVPCPAAVVEGALLALSDAGVESDLISVLLPPGFSQLTTLQYKLCMLQGEDRSPFVHDPDDEKSTAMLGVTREGQPIRINRLLSDADVVLTVSASSGDSRHGFTGLFPSFSDRETINRLEAPLAEDDESAWLQRQNEVTESSWLLGLGMIVQVVPGPGGTIAQVVAGETEKVSAAAEKQYHEVWSCRGVAADLVIATLVGDASEQTWKNLARALQAARPLLREGGSIAICSEIDAPPGEAFQTFIGNEDYDVVGREILRNGHADSWAAWQVCQALERGPVYLCSRLQDPVVESLGITPVAFDQELERLAESHGHTVVLEDAQHLRPILGDS